MILVSISVMSALSFPYRVGTPRALINMASLYIYLCGDDTTRVFVFLALFVSSLVIDNLYCQCHCANAQACEVKVYSQLARQFELMTLGANLAPAGRECGVRCVFKSEFS